jgi:hypothetical protein
MKPGPVARGARQPAEGNRWARFKVEVQGKTAACRDVLNMLFPSGEVRRIIAPSVAVGKPAHPGSLRVILQVPQAGVHASRGQKAVVRSLLPDYAVIHYENAVEVFQAP